MEWGGGGSESGNGRETPDEPPSLYLSSQNPNFNHLNTNLTNLTHNLSYLVNLTHESDIKLIHNYERNRRVSDESFIGLLTAYSILIVLGATGNSLVVLAVVRKPAMRTARNVFIINLAISDLLLCLITMPLTLMELLTQYWPLGDSPIVCSMVGTLQATSIFVSTISITAIAIDRYRVIVYPTEAALQKVGAIGILLVVWIVSFLLALPNFIWRRLDNHHVNLPGIEMISFCFEDWPMTHGRAYYSILVMVVQYCLPIITVSVAYVRIYNKLRYRMTTDRSRKEVLKMRKTNKLLISITLIFCISWFPLNLYNVVVDLHNPFGDDTETMLVTYAVCHMAGMSSACSNPLLYGWLNYNFRKEFMEIYALICPCCQLQNSVSQRNNVQTSRLNSLRMNRRNSLQMSRLNSLRMNRQNSLQISQVNIVKTTQAEEETNSLSSVSVSGHPVVVYTKASDNHSCNGVSLELQDQEVTFISQVVTTTTL